MHIWFTPIAIHTLQDCSAYLLHTTPWCLLFSGDSCSDDLHGENTTEPQEDQYQIIKQKNPKTKWDKIWPCMFSSVTTYKRQVQSITGIITYSSDTYCARPVPQLPHIQPSLTFIDGEGNPGWVVDGDLHNAATPQVHPPVVPASERRNERGSINKLLKTLSHTTHETYSAADTRAASTSGHFCCTSNIYKYDQIFFKQFLSCIAFINYFSQHSYILYQELSIYLAYHFLNPFKRFQWSIFIYCFWCYWNWHSIVGQTDHSSVINKQG